MNTTESDYTSVHAAEDVTIEILLHAEGIYDGWFADGNPLDWAEFLDRLDGMVMEDETILDLGGDLTSPAIAKIKRHVNAYRKL